MKIFCMILYAGLLHSGVADAGDSPRLDRRFGLSASLFSEPFPNFWGVGVNLNALDFLRVTAGYGRIDYSDSTLNIDVTTMGIEGKVFIPKTSFSPFVTLGISTVTGEVQGTGQISTLGAISEGRSVFTFGGGLDFQAASGFNIGVAMKSARGNGDKWVPGLYAGYYFK